MDPKLLYSELKEIHRKLSEIQLDTARNTDSLDYHIKRTDLLEKKLTMIETDQVKIRGFISIGGWVVGIGATIITLLARVWTVLK